MFGERSVKRGRTLGYGSFCETMRPRPKSSQEKDQVKSRIKPELLCDKGQCLVGAKDQGGLSLWAEVRVRGQLHSGRGWEIVRIQSKGADIVTTMMSKSACGSRKHSLPRTHGMMGASPTTEHSPDPTHRPVAALTPLRLLLPVLAIPSPTSDLGNSHSLHRSQLKCHLYCEFTQDASRGCPKSSCTP